MERSIMTIHEFGAIFGEQPPIDKKTWQEGPWHNEPDYGVFYYKEHPCFIRRHSFGGYLEGYVLIPYLDVDEYTSEDIDLSDFNDLEVHGGISFARYTDSGLILGFDCGHAYDRAPGIEEIIRRDIKEKFLPQSSFKPNEYLSTYRNIEFVRNELKNLVDQIIEKLPYQEPTSLHEAAT